MDVGRSVAQNVGRVGIDVEHSTGCVLNDPGTNPSGGVDALHASGGASASHGASHD